MRDFGDLGGASLGLVIVTWRGSGLFAVHCTVFIGLWSGSFTLEEAWGGGGCLGSLISDVEKSRTGKSWLAAICQQTTGSLTFGWF